MSDHISYYWKTLAIPLSPIDEDLFEDLLEIVETVTEFIGNAAGILVDIAEAYKVLEVGFDQLLQDLILALQAIINGIVELGMSYCTVIPTLGNLHSVEEALEKLATSVEDQYDLNRPNKTNGAVVGITMVVFIARASTIELLLPILDNIRAILNISDFQNLLTIVPAEMDFLPFTGGELPDWNSAKLVDAFPLVGDLLQPMEELLAMLPQLATIGTGLAAMAAMLEKKALQLQLLAASINAAFANYLRIAGSTFEVLVIEGIMDNSELKDTIRAGASSIPNPFDNIGAAIAVSAVGPDAGPMLELLGVT